MRAALLLALVSATSVASAQSSPPVLLRLRPHAGDTLHSWLEQRTEVTTGSATPAAASRGVTTSVSIHSRSIVREVRRTSTTVLTIVDSAAFASTDARSASMIAEAGRALRGQQLVLQIGVDGTVESARDAHGVPLSRDATDAMAAMPAVFPKQPVAVGDEWVRELPLPPAGPLGARGSGHVRAVFHLDSLVRASSMAYVSLRGEILPDSTSHGVALSGSITGTLQIDRARGWMTDSRFLVLLQSVITPPAGTGLAPMRLMTRVTQRLRTMDKR
ncbi:hypothetical protein BH11GEM1_BH11GEM1_03190 [soil metagenome]